MKCKWCSNPEGFRIYLVPLYNKSKCIFDFACIKACPYQAVSVKKNLLKIDRNKCASCIERKCASSCSTGAIRIAGYEISVEELMLKLKRDRQYWGDNGGVTLTGGEPLLQVDFVTEILKCCYDAYIHTAIETCGNVPWGSYKKTIDYTDWIFFDIKHIDSKKHLEATGVDNRRILENAVKLAENYNGELIFRTTIVPGFNDSEGDVKLFAGFLKKLPGKKKKINILPLHHLGREKYKMLGQEYFTDELVIPTIFRLQQIKKTFETSGITCYISSDTPY